MESFSVELSEDENYVYILAKADVTTELAKKWVSEAIKLAQPRGIKKYLTDVRKVKNISNVVSNYNFSYKTISEIQFDKRNRSAFLVDPNDHSHDFVETTMSNAGYDVRIFFNKNEAIQWLEA